MTIKNILIHVEPGAASEQRLKYALALAKTFDASVTGISVMPSPSTTAFAMIGDGRIYASLVEAAEESCAAARKLFEAVTAGSPVPAAWREGNGIPVEVITVEAGCADLVILGQNDERGLDAAFYPMTPAEVIMGCKRPVLVIPDAHAREFSAKCILVAWKSSPEASRAAHDSLPFLTRAEEVILAEIVPKHPVNVYALDAETMAAHLRQHGAKVTIQRAAESGEPGGQLIEMATKEGCDLIVAGGYGHSRFREWVLGGVTDTLLHTGLIPCLLSH